MKTIRVKGVYNSSNSQFHAVELEAYCVPPLTPAVPKDFGSGPGPRR